MFEGQVIFLRLKSDSSIFSPSLLKESWKFFKLMWECALASQSRLTLCDPMDCSPPGSSVHGILQARILEWVAISFSIIWKP